MAGSTNGNGSAKTQAVNVKQPKGQCHWIDWNSDFIQKVLPDPTRIFSLLVITIIIFRYLESHDWDVSLLVSGFFLNPYVVVSFALGCVTLYVSWPTDADNTKHKPLPVYDRWAVEWYWWNAWFYHMVMDGASGTFQLIPVVVHQYQMLDKRFSDHHPVPWTIGAIELFIMAPLCLATVYCILKRHPLRFPLELIVSSIQIMGMILFIAAEVMEGQLNVPALDPVGVPGDRWGNVKFDLYHFTYYWFGFWFCNLIWSVVPYYRIVRAVEECVEALAEKEKKE